MLNFKIPLLSLGSLGKKEEVQKKAHAREEAPANESATPFYDDDEAQREPDPVEQECTVISEDFI